MYLTPNAYRELHWHQANEWAYILNGSVRVAAIDEAGRTFLDDLQAGETLERLNRSKKLADLGHRRRLVFPGRTFLHSGGKRLMADVLFLGQTSQYTSSAGRLRVPAGLRQRRV